MGGAFLACTQIYLIGAALARPSACNPALYMHDALPGTKLVEEACASASTRKTREGYYGEEEPEG